MENVDLTKFLKSTTTFTLDNLQNLCQEMQKLTPEEISGFNDYARKDGNYELSKVRVYQVSGYDNLENKSKKKIEALFRLLALADQETLYAFWKMTNNLGITAGILPPPPPPPPPSGD